MFRTSAQGNLFSNPKCFRNWLISYQEHSRLVNSLICDLLIALPVDVCRLIGEFAFPCLTDLPKGHMVFKKRKIHVFLKQFFRWYYHLDAVFLEDFVEFLNQVPSRGPQFATYCMSYISATHEEEYHLFVLKGDFVRIAFLGTYMVGEKGDYGNPFAILRPPYKLEDFSQCPRCRSDSPLDWVNNFLHHFINARRGHVATVNQPHRKYRK